MPTPIPYVSLQDALKPLYFGIDVGGTSIKIGLVDSNGASIDLKEYGADGFVQSVAKIATDRNVETATQSMSREITRLMEKHSLAPGTVAGAGLGLPCTMDVKTQCLRRPPNIPDWEGYPICVELSKRINMPVIFCNDANAAAFGEYWIGSAKGHPSVALLTMGTGVGCGIIINGQSVDGSIGYGGECGHIIVDTSENAKLCGCGQKGHLEIYASATGVARRAINVTDLHASTLRSRITPETKISEIPKMVCEEAEKGDKVSLDLIREAAMYLGVGIVSILNTIDPACILIGGAMTFGGKGSLMGEKYIGWIREEINQRAFPAIAQSLTLDFALLGGDAGYIGAAGTAKSRI